MRHKFIFQDNSFSLTESKSIGIICLFVAIICFGIVGCENRYEVPPSPLDVISRGINEEISSVKSELKKLRQKAEALVSEPMSTLSESGSDRIYKFFQNKLYYSEGAGDEIAIMATGYIPVNDSIKARVHHFEKLGPHLKSAAKSSKIVSMAWLGSHEHIGAFFPPFDIVAFIPARINVPADIIPYVNADKSHNPEKASVWTEPYVDITGKGYMSTISTPVYNGDFLEGVVGLDIALSPLSDKYFSHNDKTSAPLLMLLSKNSFLIAASRSITKRLGVSSLGDFYYLQQRKKDALAPDSFRLLNHDDPEIRTLTEMVLDGRSKFKWKHGTKEFIVETRHMRDSDWYVVGLSEN